MSNLPKIAWIGLGIMGSPMSENLIKAGYDVTGFTLEQCGDCGHVFQNPRLTPEGLEFYYRDFYDGRDIPPRGCHPRDIVLHVCDSARYEGHEPSLDARTLDDACSAYFLDES